MAVYEPRTKAPSTTDKNYLHYTKGGYNYCIEIANGSCLSNCVGYAWGRWRELLGKYHNLSRANAENWWGYTSDGYKRGQTPKLGAVVCWRKGKVGVESDGAGHVGIVEEINKDNIVVSMSAYDGTRWFTRTFPIGEYDYNSFVFQGFIYLPISFDAPEGSKKTIATAKTKKAKEKAKSFKESLAGKYKTTANLNIRSGAGTLKSIMAVIPKGTVVENFGYYTDTKTVKWLYVKFTYKGVTYEGFASSKRLSKVKTSSKKSLDDWAKEVIKGKHGNGVENRTSSLKKAGCPYTYRQVQDRVEELI
jgi:surface antigen